MKKYIPLLLILVLGAFLRLWKLGIVPFGVTHDELGYIYNAFTLAKTGKNVFGQPFPFLTWMTQGGFPFMPIPIYFSAPLFWIFNISPTIGRLPSAILGVSDIFLLYILTKQIFNKNLLSSLSALFLAISPWHILFARSAYDPNFALFFYLLGICSFIYESKKTRLPFLSTIVFLLAIFSYRGMSVIALPLLVSLLLYAIFVIKITKKQTISFGIAIVAIMLCFLSVALKYGKAYTQEALFFNDPKAQEAVDYSSRVAQGPLFFKRVFLNKITYTIDKLRANYVRTYSPEYLFLYTESSGIYSIWSRGRIYFFDLFLIILGFPFIFKKYKKGAVFITAMLLIGGLPGGVGGMPYSARNFFLSAIFPILSASGVCFLLQNKPLLKLRIFLIFILIGMYTFLLSSYLFDYYQRYAFFNAESWAKSLKDLSLFVGENKDIYKNVVITNTSFGDVVQYAFWNKLSPQETQNIWKKTGSFEKPYLYKNVTFVSTCPEKTSMEEKNSLLYITHYDCKVDLKPTRIIRDYFGNPIWSIYETPTHQSRA